MKFIKNILAVSPYLNGALIIAIISIVLMESYFLDIPEVFSWGAEFGDVYYKLCLSIMASYFFYFIVVHLKNQSDKENINSFVAAKSYGIIGQYKQQIESFKKYANLTSESEYLSENEIENIFKGINPNKPDAPLMLDQIGTKATWIQYLSYHKERTQDTIKKIFVKMHFLDSKLVKILAEIDDCSHFYVVDATSSLSFGNTDMKAWAKTFYGYSLKCKELQAYNEKHLQHYKP